MTDTPTPIEHLPDPEPGDERGRIERIRAIVAGHLFEVDTDDLNSICRIAVKWGLALLAGASTVLGGLEWAHIIDLISLL